jgi:hypothetical protein
MTLGLNEALSRNAEEISVIEQTLDAAKAFPGHNSHPLVRASQSEFGSLLAELGELEHELKAMAKDRTNIQHALNFLEGKSTEFLDEASGEGRNPTLKAARDSEDG